MDKADGYNLVLMKGEDREDWRLGVRLLEFAAEKLAAFDFDQLFRVHSLKLLSVLGSFKVVLLPLHTLTCQECEER